MTATITRPPQQPLDPPPGGLPPEWLPEEPAREGRSIAKRLLLGALIVVALSAAVSIVFISNEIVSVRNAINQNPSLAVAPGILAGAGSGAPQTLLLVGDDRRALTRYYHHAVASHSNEMLLVRFDPSKPWISMLSIPRELWVTISPHNGPAVTNRINYAYTLGGSELMTETIKRVLGLSVNHVVVIDFAHFKRAIDAMGCVYSTIDRRYYHSNVGAVDQYQEIDLQPGYQKLCGDQALQFVSYRHGDTSLVRDARNQSFMLDVKKQFAPSLFTNRHRFEQIFGQAVQTDQALHTTSGVLDLLTLLVQSAGRPVRQVHFQANLLPTYDTATPQQIRSTVRQFLYGNPKPPRRHAAAVAQAVRGRRFRVRLALTLTPPPALAAARSAARALPFPLEYPRARDQFAGADPDNLRTYYIGDSHGIVHRAYVVAVSRGQLGQYYDVQGMGWTSAPMFDNPDQTVRAGTRTYSLYDEGSNLKMVAWREYGAVYWVRNTLTDDVPNSEMLAIAEETYPLSAHVAGPGHRHAVLGAFGLPPRARVKQRADHLQTYGAMAAIVAWLGMAFLALRLFAGRKELATLRARMPTALATDAHRRAAPYGVSLGVRARVLARTQRLGPRSRRGLEAAAAGIGVTADALAGANGLNGGFSHAPASSAARAASPSASADRTARAPASASLPPVNVAVLNATTRQGAAHAVAQQLRSRGITVSTVGDIPPARQSAGPLVFYASGRRAQASGLARVLGPGPPSLAPLDLATSAAAGGQAQIVVVLH